MPESYSLDVKLELVGCGCNIMESESKPLQGQQLTTSMLHYGILAATALVAVVSAHKIVSNNPMGRMAYRHTDQGVQWWA